MSKSCRVCDGWFNPENNKTGYCEFLSEKLEFVIDDIASFDPTIELYTDPSFYCAWFKKKKVLNECSNIPTSKD